MFQIDDPGVLWIKEPNEFTSKVDLDFLKQTDRKLDYSPFYWQLELCPDDLRRTIGLDYDLVLTIKSKLLKAYLKKTEDK